MGCYHVDAMQEAIRPAQGQTMAGTTVKLVLNTPEKRAEAAEFARQMREGPDQE